MWGESVREKLLYDDVYKSKQLIFNQSPTIENPLGQIEIKLFAVFLIFFFTFLLF